MPQFNTRLTPEQTQRYSASGAWPNRLLTDFLDDAAVAAPGKTAIIDSRGSITYGDLAAQVYWPERLKIARDLPRTANGKIRKADLRARLRS